MIDLCHVSGAPPEDELLAPPPDDLMMGMEGTTPLAPPSEPLSGPSPARSQGLPALSDLGNLSIPGSSLRCALLCAPQPIRPQGFSSQLAFLQAISALPSLARSCNAWKLKITQK